VGSFERFQQSRCVIEDFTSRTLAVIPSHFGRLYYVSSLKDSATGRYLHEGLADVYSQDSVQEALGQCHEELFSRILETPLPEQERDLRRCLDRGGGRVLDRRGYLAERQVVSDHVSGGLAELLKGLVLFELGSLAGRIFLPPSQWAQLHPSLIAIPTTWPTISASSG